MFLAYEFERRASQLSLLQKPLRRDQRLDDRAAAPAFRDRELVVNNFLQQPQLLEFLDDTLARLVAVEAIELRAGLGGHARVLVNDLDHRQVVALAHRVVCGVVRGRDLDRARAELRVNEVVGDDRNLAVDDGQ